MSIVLTYWEDPWNKNDPEDFDGIKTVVVKTVKDIPSLIERRPAHCTMVSTERTGKKKYFKQVWRGDGTLRKVCPRCNGCGRV